MDVNHIQNNNIIQNNHQVNILDSNNKISIKKQQYTDNYSQKQSQYRSQQQQIIDNNIKNIDHINLYNTNIIHIKSSNIEDIHCHNEQNYKINSIQQKDLTINYIQQTNPIIENVFKQKQKQKQFQFNNQQFNLIKNNIFIFSQQQSQIQKQQIQYQTSRRQLNKKEKQKVSRRKKKNNLRNQKNIQIQRNLYIEHQHVDKDGQQNKYQKKKQQQQHQNQQQQHQNQQQQHQFQQSQQQQQQKSYQQQQIFFPCPQYILKSSSFITLINSCIPKNKLINIIIKRSNSNNIFNLTIKYQCYLLQDKKYLISCMKNRLFKTVSHYEFVKGNKIYDKKDYNNGKNNQQVYGIINSNISRTEYVFKTIIKKQQNNSQTQSQSEKSTSVDHKQLLINQNNKNKINQQNTYENIQIQAHNQTLKVFLQPQSINKKTNHNQQSFSSHNNTAIPPKQCLYIAFNHSFLFPFQQRQVSVINKKKSIKLPHNHLTSNSSSFSCLKQLFQHNISQNYHKFTSKKAKKSKNGQLQLDFKGFAKMESNKNIILQNDKKQNVLIFGKIKENYYCVSIGYPFSILEGLAFSIANLDRKFFFY